ncbi:MAG: DnaJ domain-containing protein [Thermomonas haemolytica]
MDGAKGSALEWALALLQAPGERHLLRQKPLPDGMESLLAIAAGAAPEALAQAMATFGESESRLREAAQFYVREVLFFPQADAYRMLGVAADAPFEQIKTHHRLLQSWLHPDRPHSEEDAAFAARVNAAWNHLRSPERRRDYDEALRNARPSEVFDSGSRPALVPGWRPLPEPVAAEVRWRRRLPILALLALCAVLAVLALRDMESSPEPWEEPAPGALAQATGSADDAELAPSVPLAPARGKTREADGRATDKPLPSAARLVPRREARVAVERLPARPAPAVVAGVSSPAISRPGRSKAVMAVARAPETASHGVRDTAAARPAASAAVAVPPSSLPSVVANAGQPLQPAPVAAAAPAVAQPPMPAPAASDGGAPDFARLQAARQTGEMLLRFMQSPGRASPPIWNSPRVEDEAEQLRRRLHAGGRVRLAPPQWQIGNDSAELGSAVAGASPAAGQLLARLHWRDGYWLVTGIRLEGNP